MIWLIARREIADHLRSVRFVALCLLVLVLMPLGAYVNTESYESRQAYHEVLRDAQAERLDSGRRPVAGFRARPNDPGLRALRPPEPLSILAMGHDGSLPAYWQFTIEGVVPGPPLARPEGLAGLVGEVDFLFVVQVILGLLAVLLAFDGISGEKERGTLRAVLAHPVPRLKVILGKFVGGLVTLFVPLVLGTVASLLVLQLLGQSLLTGGALGRLALFIVGAGLYLSTLLALGLAVSSVTHRQRTSLVLLLVIWVSLVLVLPRAAALVAAAARPVEPHQVTERRIERALEPIDTERRERLQAAWVAEGQDPTYLTTEVDPETRERYGTKRREIDLEMFRRRRDVIRDIEAERSRQLEGQRSLAAIVARLSPAASFGFLATEATGTGDANRQRWERRVEQHQRRLEQLVFDRVVGFEVWTEYGASTSTTDEDEEKVPTYAELPRLDLERRGLPAVIRQASFDVVWLALFNLAALVFAGAAFLRYDVR
jgi:ABC-type transport system involved in multi-copper enzyme maturation permease subunit